MLCLPIIVRAETTSQKDKKNAEPTLQENSSPENHLRYSCEADISYVWEHREKPKKNRPQERKATKKKIPPKRSTVYFKTASEIGNSEDEAKAKLQTKLKHVKTEAFKQCEHKHTKMANCLAGGIRKHNSNYRLLDFRTRRSILNALEEDCHSFSGQCIKTLTSPVTCNATSVAPKENTETEKDKDSAKSQTK